jgi:hypothetical protein
VEKMYTKRGVSRKELASLSLCTKNASEIENITYPVLSTIDFQ